MGKVILPDGGELTEARAHTIATGYDHYWRFHKNPLEWAELCPICSEQALRITDKNKRESYGG